MTMTATEKDPGAEEARVCVERLRQRANGLFEERIFSHPFNQELFEGRLAREKFVGFLKNWYTFSVEINTGKCAAVDLYLPFLKRHPDCYDILSDAVADELIHPGPGGHVKMFIPLAAAFDVPMSDLVNAKLIPEARALVDVRCRLLRVGPFAEAIAASLSESSIGEWLGRMGRALEKHYGLTSEQTIYFSKHYEADTQEHEQGSMAHGLGMAYILQKIIEDGYRPERPGFDLEYTAELSIHLYELFL